MSAAEPKRCQASGNAGVGLGRNLGSQPSPVGRGCRASAFSSAEARRVRGSFHSQANRCYTVPVLISTQRVRELRRISLLRIPNGLVLEDPEGFVGKVRKAMKARACRAQQKPLTRPATADDTAVAGHPLPKGEGCHLRFYLTPDARHQTPILTAPSLWRSGVRAGVFCSARSGKRRRSPFRLRCRSRRSRCCSLVPRARS